MATVTLPTNDALDVLDAYTADEDSCTEAELSEIFPAKYQVRKKTVLSESFQDSNTCVQLVANHTEDTLAAANRKGVINLVDVKSGRKTFSVEAHSSDVTGLKFCNGNSSLLYSCSLDHCVKLLDSRTGDFVHTYKHQDEQGNGKKFTCLDVNCSSEFLCAGTSLISDEDAYIVFWDVRNGNKMLGSYSESHSNDITQVKFHPSKRQQLASAAMDSLINIYDISQKSESDAFSQCINFETTPDAIVWDTHSNHPSKMFAVSHPQLVQYWDIDGTTPTANLKASKLCKAMKRSNPDQCHFISLNFDSDLNPLLMLSSNLSCDSQPNACIRTLMYNRDKMKVKPHAVLELQGKKSLQVFDSVYLAASEVYVTLESGSLRYWGKAAGKRPQGDGASSWAAAKKQKS